MSEHRERTSVLGAGAIFKGELTFEGDARIHGVFEGSIRSPGEVHVAPGAHVKGSIHSATISVDGKVDGDLTATDRLELLAHANVKGDLACKLLVVVQGAVFSGKLDVGPDALNHKRTEAPAASNGLVKPAARPPKSKPDPDWLAEPITTPAARIPDWSAQVAPLAKPAWMEPPATVAKARPD